MYVQKNKARNFLEVESQFYLTNSVPFHSKWFSFYNGLNQQIGETKLWVDWPILQIAAKSRDRSDW